MAIYPSIVVSTVASNLSSTATSGVSSALSPEELNYMTIDHAAVREAIADFNRSLNTYSKYSDMYGRGIKKVIFNPPATIVFWNDDTKTVVKANNEPFDWEKGIAMAYVKKMCGNRGNYYNLFRKHEEDGLKAQGNPQEGETVEVSYDFSKTYVANPTAKIEVFRRIGDIAANALGKTTNSKNSENVISTRNIAAEIVEEFEAILDKHNIDIPDEDRDQDPNAASLYGITYSNLLDAVEEKISSALRTMKANPDLKIAEGVFY